MAPIVVAEVTRPAEAPPAPKPEIAPESAVAKAGGTPPEEATPETVPEAAPEVDLTAASVAELAAPFAMSQPAISKHLKVLERAGLISVGQDAQRRPRRIEGRPLAEASGWLERYRGIWEQNFTRLDGLLEELQRRPVGRQVRQRTKKRGTP